MKNLWPSLSADFKQRTRQQSFIVTLLAMSVLTFMFFPAPDAHYQTLVISNYRGIYNSAWLGICLAMLNVLFLPLICFYLIKNAITLDRQSMTGELIAATPVSKFTYLFAKWCSSVGILLTIILVMLISTIFIQLFYGESYQLDFWALIWPQLVFVLPILLAIASIAIMFESIKWLRGGLGNVAYFFIWIGGLVQSVESSSGIGKVMVQMDAEVTARFPDQQGNTNIGVSISDEAREVSTFVWQGIEPTTAHLLGATPSLIISLVFFIIALLCFDRFKQNTPRENAATSRLSSALNTYVLAPLDTLFANLTRFSDFTRMLRLELKLMLKGRSIYWIIGLIGLNIAQLFVTQAILISIILPISWLWCVLVISQLGQFEKQSNTLELMTYSRRSFVSQYLASLCAALVLLALASAGSVLRFVGTGEWLYLVQLLVALLFTVSLAYFCGSFTGNKRLFEVLYPALWYLGPLQGALYVDFFGINSQQSWQAGMPYVFTAIAMSMFLITLQRNKSR